MLPKQTEGHYDYDIKNAILGNEESGKLKLCPFCGKLPKVHYESDKIGYYIECECQIHYKYWSLNEAVDRWNRRIDETNKV